MRDVQEVLEGEERLLYVLRWVYILYAGFFLSRAGSALFSVAFDVPGPVVLANVLLALVGLTFVIVAIRHLANEPFACALALAGLQTIAVTGFVLAFGVAASQLWLTLTGLLWLAVLATARSSRVVAEWQSGLSFDRGRSDEIRTVVAILLIYAARSRCCCSVRPSRSGGRSSPTAGSRSWASRRARPGTAGRSARPFRSGVRGSIPGARPRRDGRRSPDRVVVRRALRGRVGAARADARRRRSGDLLLTVALPALTEEWLCRGVLWSAIRRGAGTTATILVTATLFALLHRTGDAAPTAVPLQLVGGLALGWLRARTGSLIPCMLAHAAFNATLLALL